MQSTSLEYIYVWWKRQPHTSGLLRMLFTQVISLSSIILKPLFPNSYLKKALAVCHSYQSHWDAWNLGIKGPNTAVLKTAQWLFQGASPAKLVFSWPLRSGCYLLSSSQGLEVSYVLLKGFSNTGLWSSVLFLLLHCITAEALENRMPCEGEAVTCKMTMDGTWQPVEAPSPLGAFLSLGRLQSPISYPGPLESKCCSPHLITKSHCHAADVGKAKGVYLCAWRLFFPSLKTVAFFHRNH